MSPMLAFSALKEVYLRQRRGKNFTPLILPAERREHGTRRRATR